MDFKDQMRVLYREVVLRELKSMAKEPDDGLTYQDTLYIDFIALTPGCTASYIADTLGIARSAVTVRLNRLERKGIIVRTRSEADGRSFILSLSPDYTYALEWYSELFDEYCDLTETEFPAEDIEAFRTIIAFIYEKIEKDRSSKQSVIDMKEEMPD